MKKKTTKDSVDLATDDELLRTQSMEDGDIEFGDLTMRPTTALTISWMQRNNVFDETRDMIWRGAAFGFLHCEPMPKIRAVVNDKDLFIDAVDSWIEQHIENHEQVKNLSAAMSKAFGRYMASTSTLSQKPSGN